jgi:hypothetical protein
MKKWVLSALSYLIVVVGSYYAYTAITSNSVDDVDHSKVEQHED